jgi:hypothetical protein
MDGLQCSSGASMGKRNIKFAWDSRRNADEPPEICVLRAGADGRPQRGLSYRVAHKTLSGLKEAVATKTLEAYSRRLAATDPAELFQIRSLTNAEIEGLAAIFRSSGGD